MTDSEDQTEREWEVTVTLRTSVFGTAPQAMESVTRWRDLLEVWLSREVDLVETRIEGRTKTDVDPYSLVEAYKTSVTQTVGQRWRTKITKRIRRDVKGL